MAGEVRLIERPSLRMGLLSVVSALFHLIILVAVSGSLGGADGVSRLPDIICVSLVPRPAPDVSDKPEAFEISEDKKDELVLDVSARANVPEEVDEIAIDRFRKARVSKPVAESPPERSTSEEQRIVPENFDKTSRLKLAEGSGGASRLLFFPFKEHPDGPPKPIECRYEYPNLAREIKAQGVVVLSVEVLEDGSVGDIYVKESSGSETLDKSALQDAKQCRFIPAHEDGRPVTRRIIWPWRYNLDSDIPPF